jgi:hypothetical protein
MSSDAVHGHWYDLPIGTSRAHIYLNALVGV